jgi:hypothetical protein
MNAEQITEIIKQNSLRIAEQAYPILPMGNTELEFTVGSEDGEYTEKMDAMHLSFARVHFTAAIANNIPVALAQAALTLAMHEELRKQICDNEANFYYDSDGHYETGNTPAKNREKFWAAFPSRADFRAYMQEASK